MRLVNIQVYTGSKGMKQMKAAFRKNYKHYLREAVGLGIFMMSACFFSVMIFSDKGAWQQAIHGSVLKSMVMGSLMGATALFIFYSPWTAPSGSQINPAVTITFLSMDKMCRYDAFFFIVFQLAGGTAAVFLMQELMGPLLIDPPVSSAVTIPGKAGVAWAALTEFLIAFVTMSVVLFTSSHWKWKRYTRIFSSVLVCCWVIISGPVSGFGMNPARSFASAFPSGIWTAFWIYLFIPVLSMLLASQFFIYVQKKKNK